MRLNPLLTLAAFLGLTVFCSPLLAHHGNAAFAEKPILKASDGDEFLLGEPAQPD